jgi:hypothetical protein
MVVLPTLDRKTIMDNLCHADQLCLKCGNVDSIWLNQPALGSVTTKTQLAGYIHGVSAVSTKYGNTPREFPFTRIGRICRNSIPVGVFWVRAHTHTRMRYTHARIRTHAGLRALGQGTISNEETQRQNRLKSYWRKA